MSEIKKITIVKVNKCILYYYEHNGKTWFGDGYHMSSESLASISLQFIERVSEELFWNKGEKGKYKSWAQMYGAQREIFDFVSNKVQQAVKKQFNLY